MTKENKTDLGAFSPKTVGKRCPIHGVRLEHVEVDKLIGWQCPVEECPFFEPDLMGS